jgi:Domain of unknown function (DUF2437)
MKFLRLESRSEARFGALEGGDTVRVFEGGIGSLLDPVVGRAPSRVIVRRGRRAIRKASAGRLPSINGSRRLQ